MREKWLNECSVHHMTVSAAVTVPWLLPSRTPASRLDSGWAGMRRSGSLRRRTCSRSICYGDKKHGKCDLRCLINTKTPLAISEPN